MDILIFMMLIVLALSASFLYLAILGWLLLGTLRIVPPPASEESPSLDIFVAARNESGRLERCLDALARQVYAGPWQVWIIDDHSSDATRTIAAAAASRHANFHLLRSEYPQRWKSRKKGALATAVQNSDADVLLFTDADCAPPQGWAAAMAAALTPPGRLCAGFSPLHAANSSALWQQFLDVDTLTAALVAAGGIGHGVGITCTGRSLGCRRQTLAQIGGHAALPDTLSGDDDFLLQAAAAHSPHGLTFLLSPETAVPAAGPAGWTAFIRQKRRHLSAGQAYRPGLQAGYLAYHVANAALWAGLCLAPLLHSALALGLAVKIGADSLTLRFWSRRLGRPLPFAGILLWEFLYPLYHLLALPVSAKETRW